MSKIKTEDVKNKTAETRKEEAVREAFPYGFDTMEVIPNGKSKYHKDGEKIKIGRAAGEKMIAKGWAVEAILTILVMFFLSLVSPAIAQEGVDASLKNTTYTTLTLDTVTNTGTASLTSGRIGGGGTTTTVALIATKISGTVGGTIVLHGSVSGLTASFKPLNQIGTQTALATITATDATNYYYWIITGSPHLYYCVVWTGTMAASLSARLIKH